MADFGKLNLGALSHQVMNFKKKGSKTETVECIVIPIQKNHLFKSKKGNIYLDVVAFKLKNPTKDDETGQVTQTHLVKQSLPKEVRDAMSEQEKKDQPIIGSLNIFEGGFTESAPNVDDDLPPAPGEGDEDLPF